MCVVSTQSRTRTYKRPATNAARRCPSRTALPIGVPGHRVAEVVMFVHGSPRAAGVGIEPTPPGSKPGITTSSDYPAIFKSALRESNPPRQVGSLEPLPLGQEHLVCRSAKSALFVVQRKERESNPQGSSLDRFRSGCHHHLACPSVLMFKSCGGRNRTCVRAVNSRLPVPARVPPQSFIKSERLNSNQRSSGPRPDAITKLRHVLIVLLPPAARVGVEPNLLGLKDR